MNFNTFGVYFSLVATMAIAVWAIWKTWIRNRHISREPKTNTDEPELDTNYFTAKGTLDERRLFFSVFATTFSAFTVVGLPAMFYSQGVGTFFWMGIGIALTPLTLHLIGKKIIARGATSPAGSVIGLLTSDYKSRSLTLILSLVTVLVLFPYLTLQIAGIGKFLLSASDGQISYAFGAAFVCLIVAAYVITGGAAADAETDYIQGPILILGVVALGAVICYEVYGEIGENIDRLSAAGLWSIAGPRGYFSSANLISFGIIFTLISISTPQVSQRLLGAKSPGQLKLIMRYYAPVGLIVVAFAGLMGLYAASNLDIATPDFVAGDVLRSLVESSDGIFRIALFIIGALFITAVISASVSTIDSILIAIAGIASDNLEDPQNVGKRRKLKPLSWVIILAGLVFSANPPTLITDLASIQLSGLTALLPCLLGPLYGYSSRTSGWAALGLGMLPIMAPMFVEYETFDIDAGVIGLVLGIIGLHLGRLGASKSSLQTGA